MSSIDKISGTTLLFKNNEGCFMIYILGLIILMIFVFAAIIRVFGGSDDNSDTDNYSDTTTYIPKKFLSNKEYNFLTKFIDLEDELHVNIVPQVNLASIIEKVSDSRFHNELFRNIDYGIFSADYSKVLLLIELNDDSHNDYHRRERDKKVRKICDKVGIKLITFYTKYSNEKDYVKNRIKESIGEFESNSSPTS